MAPLAGTNSCLMRYDSAMTRLAAIVLSLGLLAAGAPAHAASDGPYDIMKPEPCTPGVANPYVSPRRTQQRSRRVLPAQAPEQRWRDTPPPIVMPGTGQVVPSVPVVPRGSVPGGGAESFGDRAARCAHQSGLAGLPGDQRGTYMGTCINQ